tara:strand:+ start:120 stop:332 length:213 start_codon:yes stop_codon:yes gene_type:complete
VRVVSTPFFLRINKIIKMAQKNTKEKIGFHLAILKKTKARGGKQWLTNETISHWENELMKIKEKTEIGVY